MIDVHWVIVGALISAFGASMYVRDTLRGTSQPNRVTFVLWAAAPLLAFGVQVSSGVGLRSLMTFMAGAAPVAVLIASFANRSAVWRIGPFDWVCGGLSVAGTLWWLVSGHGVVGIVAAVAADLLTGIPTAVKSWRAPESETAVSYVCGMVNAGVTLLTVTRFSAIVALFPAYIFAFTAVQVVLVAGRLGPRWRARLGVAAL